MGIVHRLEYQGTEQSIVFVPEAYQASATWELHDLRYPATAAEYVAAAGSSTVDGVSQLLAVDAGPSQPSPYRIRLPSTAGFEVGRRYLLRSPGSAEVVRVDGIVTDTHVTTKAPIIGTYLADDGAQLLGVELVANIPDAIAADASRMEHHDVLRIVWALAGGRHHQAQVRVLRHGQGDADLTQAVEDIRTLWTDIAVKVEHHRKDTIAGHVQVFARQLDAMERGRGSDPTLQLRGEERHWALVWGTLRHMAALGITPGNQETATEWRAHCDAQFVTFWNGATTGVGSTESAKVERSTGAATGNRDLEHRTTILGL